MVELFRRKRRSFFEKLKKRTPLEKFYDENYQFLWYVFISVGCTILFLLIFVLFTYVLTDKNYLLANTIAYIVSFTALYYLDRELFKARNTSKKKLAAQASAFLIVRLIGFPLDSSILFFLVDRVGMSELMGKFFGSLIMFCYNYITNKLFVFKIKD